MDIDQIFANELHFPLLVGPLDDFPVIPAYQWLSRIAKRHRVWISLWEDWHTDYDLPPGYDIYIMSWHNEAVNLDRLRKQSARRLGHIFALSDGLFYDQKISGVTLARYIYWHHACNKIAGWYPEPQVKHKPQFKFSAICNRVTQSKVWVVTKLLETVANDCIIKLGDWIEQKNVHDWQSTSWPELDRLTDIFRTKYLNQKIDIDAFDNASQNRQRLTSDPWQFYVQAAALNFTNESFAYSFMVDDNGESSIYPGPFLTEKTWKCLVGGCPIVAVGQFDTYRNLVNLGFEFDYGFDLAYDNDAKNLSRAKALVDLIDDLSDRGLDRLVADSRASSQHNRNWILNGGFAKKCQDINDKTIEHVLQLITS